MDIFQHVDSFFELKIFQWHHSKEKSFLIFSCERGFMFCLSFLTKCQRGRPTSLVPFQAIKRKATISILAHLSDQRQKMMQLTKDTQGLPQTGELSNIGTRSMVLLLSNRFENFPIKNLLPCHANHTLEMWIKGGKTGLGSETGPGWTHYA